MFDATCLLLTYSLFLVLGLTDNGWSQYGCDSLEEEKKTECVCQFVQPQEVDKDDWCEADISTGGHTEDSTKYCLASVVSAEVAHSQSYSMKNEIQKEIVEVRRIEKKIIFYIPSPQTAKQAL